METNDPIAALLSKRISDRAAGARDLSLMGGVEHLERLAGLAGQDRSPAVRLGAAAAAADILSRVRVGSARKRLKNPKRDELIELFRRVDPNKNAGVFSILACVDRPQSFHLIAGGLRDPHADTRLGASVGLMRLCSSISVQKNTKLAAAVVALMQDERHKPDALAEIARVCAAVGYDSAKGVMRYLALSGVNGEVVQHSLSILEGNEAPLTGAWYSDGRDAGETNPTPVKAPAFVVFDGKGALVLDGKNWQRMKGFSEAPCRRMFIRRAGEDAAAPSFQAHDRTWYSANGPGLTGQIDARFADLAWDSVGETKTTKVMEQATEAMSKILPESSTGHRLVAQLAAATGQVELARAGLESAIAGTKTPTDCWFFLGELLWSLGKKKEAKAHYATFVKKGKRKDNPGRMERAKERAG